MVQAKIDRTGGRERGQHAAKGHRLESNPGHRDNNSALEHAAHALPSELPGFPFFLLSFQLFLTAFSRWCPSADDDHKMQLKAQEKSWSVKSWPSR